MITRILFFLVLLVLADMPAISQATDDAPMRTLLGGDKKLHHGGWGGVSTHYTRIMDQDALLSGVRGGWIIDHRLTIGIAGHGLVTQVANKGYDELQIAEGGTLRRRSSMYMGYGGLLFEPVLAYRSPIHISLPIIIGAGGVTYGNAHWASEEREPFYTDERYDAQAFFVVEPGVELEFNVISLVRVGIGASYRYTTDLDLPATPKDALHGLNAGFSLKVGCF